MSAHFQLTEQQQAVVAHNEGPALVFAVAGAGKTTAMVHRIERLVRAGIFAPDRILATSFGRSNARDLRRSLNVWPHCAAVRASTLHALGRHIILRAQQHGYAQNLKLNDSGEASFNIMRLAKAAARQQTAPYKHELESPDEQDFLDYVAACKGNLIYPDLESRNLPASARQIAAQAVPSTSSSGFPRASFTTPMSRQRMPAENPVPRALTKASLAANRAAKCSSGWGIFWQYSRSIGV